MRPTVLVVTEDARFASHSFDQLKRHGVRQIACLGPAHGPCRLERGGCPLADHSTIALVDGTTGAFGKGASRIPAGTYAGHLQARHPRPWVLLAPGPSGATGTTGEVTTVDRDSVVELLGCMLESKESTREVG